MKAVARILSALVLFCLFLSLCACGAPAPTLPEGESYRFPGEYEPHEGTWLIWPHDQGLLTPECIDRIDEVWLIMAKALHTGENVHIVAYDEAHRQYIHQLLESEGLDMSRIDYLICETDQFWARDCGPMFAFDGDGRPVILDFGFNGYGRMDKFGEDVPQRLRWELPEFVREEYMENFIKDDRLAAAVAEHLGLPCIDLNDFVLEGGAVELDGQGSLITTESCILNDNRNPGLSRQDAESLLKACFGAENILWLKGSPDEDITDGHIDGLLRFADEHTIVTSSEEDYYEIYDYTPRGDYETVVGAVNAQGEPYTIVELPLTAEPVEILGWRNSYLNYYAGNEVVLVPVYGDVMDEEALRILGEVYPDKEILPVDGDVISYIGGGIHCVTQQQPLF